MPKSTQAVVDEMEILEAEMRIAMFAAGAVDVAALREPERLVSMGELYV